MQLFLRKAASNTNVSSHFRVGADAYIGPLGSCDFAENLRENGAFCRDDVGIGPLQTGGQLRDEFALGFRILQLPAANHSVSFADSSPFRVMSST